MLVNINLATAFHIFTVGACMLGWHKVPTGFVSLQGRVAKTVPKPVSAYMRVHAVKILIVYRLN